jgi:hypothetical protein
MKNLACLSLLSLAPIFAISASDQQTQQKNVPSKAQKIVYVRYQPKPYDQPLFIVKNSMTKVDCEKDCPNQGTLYSNPEKECCNAIAHATIQGSSRFMKYLVHMTRNVETKRYENVSVISWRYY